MTKECQHLHGYTTSPGMRDDSQMNSSIFSHNYARLPVIRKFLDMTKIKTSDEKTIVRVCDISLGLSVIKWLVLHD